MATLTGHTSEPTSLAFSPDDELLVSGSWDNTARLWDVAAKRQLKTLPEQRLPVCVAISPDGKALAMATGSWRQRHVPGEVRLWEVASLKELGSLPNHGTRFNTVCFSPDGKILACAGADRIVRLWDLAKRSQRAELPHRYDVYSIAFLAKGKLLATAEYGGKVSLWDLQTAHRLAVYEGHEQKAYCVAFSPDGTLLASAGGDGAVKLWPTSNHQPTTNTSAAVVQQWAAAVRKPN